MAKITNHARGPRGITLKDGTTVWLDPGQSEDIEKKDIAGPLPDLGTAPKAAEADDGELGALRDQVADLTKQVEALKGENSELTKIGADLAKEKADLTKQVEALKGENSELTKIGADLAKEKADLTKQVEALTKPADKK